MLHCEEAEAEENEVSRVTRSTEAFVAEVTDDDWPHADDISDGDDLDEEDYAAIRFPDQVDLPKDTHLDDLDDLLLDFFFVVSCKDFERRS